MSNQQPSRQAGGVGLIVIIAALAAAGVGLALDLAVGGAGRFWTLAEPGMSAAIGAGVALIAALLGHVARAVLRSAPPPQDGAP